MTKFLRRRDKSVFFLRTDPITFMRLSCLYSMIFLSTATVLAASPSRGQGLDQEIFIGMDHENLEALIKKIEAASDFTSAYYSSAFEPYNDITFEPAKRTIREALELGFRGTGLEYTVKGNVIVVGNRSVGVLGTSSPVGIGDATLASVRVTGKVKDSNGTPLPGVNVLVKGTTIGTATDVEGTFVLDMPEEGKILVFSFVGLKTVEMDATGRVSFDVTMEPDVATLQTVEISGGYYKTTNRSKTGSIVKVTADEIGKQPVTNPLMALQGRVPGLEIVPYSGGAGGAVKVVIRGRNSLRNNTLEESASGPLFVVDGVPIDASPLRSSASGGSPLPYGYDPLSTLNPESIESVEILKDGDATAIYGSRGANGVILITTKRSTQKDRSNVDISAYSGVGRIVNRMDVLNTEQYLAMRREAFANDGVEPGMFDFDINGTWDQTRNTDWQEELLGGSARISDVQAGLSGGNGNTTFKLDGGFHKESVIYPGDFGYQRLTGNFTINHSSPNQKLAATVSIMYGADKSSVFEDFNFVNYALRLPPNAPPLYNDDGTLNWEIVDFGYFKLNSFNNPVAGLKNTNNSKAGNLIVNSVLSYSLGQGIMAKVNMGFTGLNREELLKFPIEALSPTTIFSSTTGSNTFGRSSRGSWIIEPQMTYSKIAEGHNLTAIIGASLQESTSQYQSITGFGYLSDVLLDNLRAASFTSITVDTNNQYKYLAFFMRVGYDWKEKYLLSLTGRRDGSSRFGPGKQFGNFGAVGVGWVFSNEALLRDKRRILSFGKLRASYGITGSDQIGDYKFYNTYSISRYPYDNNVALSPTALYNPNYSWESTRKLEGAVELSFLEDKVSLEVSFYRNRSSNQLVNYQLPVITGFSGVLSNFNATVENAGWEAMLGINPIQTDHFHWNFSVNFSANKNKLVEFPGIENSSYSKLYEIGKPLSVQRLYTYEGVNPETGSQEVADFNDDGVLDDKDRRFMSPLGPTYYGGINNTISFRSFDLSFLFQFVRQKQLGYVYPLPGAAGNAPVSVLNRWQREGDVTDVGRFSQDFMNSYYYTKYVSASDYPIEDASFVRLKSISLSYTFPTSIIERTALSQAKIFVQGQNLLTISDYSGFDPETGTSVPPLRMFTLGIQVRF
ncbi:SusC/RagA family TonB-linked outer membrane protein [Dawidia soli]|uniref:SusC/RagA family TonB-linked outer membrane protein n=1 Tax=Dawidia soli TaxID=2782352 RepID=A0AAP2GI49_9BACT|nr:SusC/RagA family TonB-linked outer membrane protein [Dawidia soli]MBT1687110.1 SusC/RagA family TonB-linked outer membrane protein [Dawidia soli]